MEKTTLISASGYPFEREVPKIRIFKPFNEGALEWLIMRTGIDFKHDIWGNIEGQPETWEQFAKVFLTYNFLTHSINDGHENVIICRVNCNVPLNATLRYKIGDETFLGVHGFD